MTVGIKPGPRMSARYALERESQVYHEGVDAGRGMWLVPPCLEMRLGEPGVSLVLSDSVPLGHDKCDRCGGGRLYA